MAKFKGPLSVAAHYPRRGFPSDEDVSRSTEDSTESKQFNKPVNGTSGHLRFNCRRSKDHLRALSGQLHRPQESVSLSLNLSSCFLGPQE